ncbi:MAG: isoprenyl transferase [Lachnospiraceae bacterium]|nr:isoprenyl transferase [Lachnospiraceae bacterium]
MSNIPQHVAIILDGNGRWAKSKGMPRTYGHTMGAKNVEPICRAAHNLGIKYITFYAFSTENWNRPDNEVEALMDLLESYMKTCKKLAKNNNMRVRIIGDITKFTTSMQEKIKDLEEYSKDFDGLNMQIALNYGSRDEIVRGVNKYIDDLQKNNVSLPLTEEVLSSYLDTKDIPDPDLMIRTSGEQRLSNYLLWQLAYAEFYFTEVPWPDFHEKELKEAVEAYMNRDRRYGKV